MQSISPEIIFRGNDAWEKALPQIINLTKSPLILGRSIYTNDLRNKIFNDLEELHNFCRTEGYPFNEADLYKSDARVWQAFQKYKNWIRAKNRNRGRR